MQEEINSFIKHTIVNLEGALMKDDDMLTLAILTNLADTIESYIEALELSVLSDTMWGQEK
jgi:hypothetical protein